MNSLNHIIKNHYITHIGNCIIAYKCRAIPLEIVVRGYITGNTDTSLWTHYEKGSRLYCGNQLPDGLVKNQQLPEPIVTPTTKDKNDRPISSDEIISSGILTENEWKYVKEKSLALFSAGQKLL